MMAVNVIAQQPVNRRVPPVQSWNHWLKLGLQFTTVLMRCWPWVTVRGQQHNYEVMDAI